MLIFLLGLIPVISVVKLSEDRITWGEYLWPAVCSLVNLPIPGITATYIPKRNHLNARTAGKDSVSRGPWRFTRSFTWRSLPTSARSAREVSIKDPTWRPTCWLTLTTSRTNAISAGKYSGEIAISGDTSSHTPSARIQPAFQNPQTQTENPLTTPQETQSLNLVQNQILRVLTLTSLAWATTASYPSKFGCWRRHRNKILSSNMEI